MEALRRTRLQATGLLAITFTVGALVGAAVERAVKARGNDPAVASQTARREPDRRDDRNGRGGRGDRRVPIFLEPQVLDELKITVDQRTRIEAILKSRDQQTRLLFEAMKPRMDVVMDSTRREIRALMTQEQRDKLDAIIKERHQRREQEKQRHEGKPRSDSARK